MEQRYILKGLKDGNEWEVISIGTLEKVEKIKETLTDSQAYTEYKIEEYKEPEENKDFREGTTPE